MKIELPSAVSTAANSHATQAALEPNLKLLLDRLNLELGARAAATVVKVVALSAEQQQALVAEKNQSLPLSQRSVWRPLLAQPNVNLVELKLGQAQFHTLTEFALKPHQPITVLVTSKGLQLVVDAAPASNSSPTNGRAAGFMDATGQTIGTLQIPPSRLLQQEGGEPAAVAPRALIVHGRGNTTMAIDGLASQSTPAPFVQPRPRPSQALAEAVASALPKAAPASLMLSSNIKLISLLQHVPEQSMPRALEALAPLLSKLEAQSLKLSSSQPLPTKIVAQAIHNNGVFHERNALSLLSQPDRAAAKEQQDADIKSLLIRTLDSMAQFTGTRSTATPKPNLSNDAVARLWFTLVRAGSKTQEKSGPASSRENLLVLAQTLAESSLAKIQLNQYRSLHSGAEAAPQNPVIHLDIPLKWPDGYGNAYLQILPPDDGGSNDKAQQQERRKRLRWSIYMQLQLGDDGELAVELSVAEERVGVTFWAEKLALRQKAAAHLQHLRSNLSSQGLEVKELRCADGPPPEKKIKLDYALIDVKT